MSRQQKLIWLIALLLLVGNGLTWHAVWRESRGGVMRMVFLDVGQGDAIYIEAPNGNQVLVDGGPGKAVLRQLSAVMPWYDKSLDLVIATHPDADHISGLVPVLGRYQVKYFLEPGVEGETGVYKELEKAVTEQEASGKLEKILARRGVRVVLDTEQPPVYLDILFPDRDPSGWETNTASIVARLTYGESSFLLTGDSPRAIEQYLVALGNREPASEALALQSDVLKAGHHGSKTSSDPAFVMAVAPEYAIISAGKNNKYGHPHEETISTLEQSKIKVLRTTDLGNIEFKTDGLSLKPI